MDVILGTAGHIDHGKTSLVRALTGINCDRLDEEKRRGITIDLGFAWLDLPDGRRLGIVDVPGHERFVKTMVAGASGIDCMMLVIAADEGVMPQTREHLDICTLLGVRSGIVALTKTDMVDADWLEMVKDDVAANLQGTFLEGAPILPVSSASGAGIDELRQAVFQLVSSMQAEKGTNILRLPVDRVFTLKGFGTVVTGTIVSGTCAQGEELAVMPTDRQTKARSLQVHGKAVEEARHGQRCAMNLQAVEVEDIQRGDVITRPGTLFPSRRWLARIFCLSSAPHPIKQRMEAHFHHGAKECSARIVFRDREELQPGDSAICEIHMAMPMVGIFGDHCVIRAHSPLRTIAGGVLLDPLPPILRKRDPSFAKKFAMLEKLGQIAEKMSVKLTDKDAEELVRLALALSGVPGADEKRLAVLTGLPTRALAAAIGKDASRGEIICWDNAGKCWVEKEAFATSLEKCRARAVELHEREPLKGFFAHNALCSGWGEKLPPKYTQKVLDEAVKKGILKEEGNGLKLAEWEIRPDADQSATMDRLLKIYQDAAFTPPMLKEIQEGLETDPKQTLSILAHLCETGQLARIQEGLYYSRPILDNILARVREWFKSHENLDVGDMKTILGVSRKYAIPLLEYLDASRVTYRVGNMRQLKK